jgi:hypothetical protein
MSDNITLPREVGELALAHIEWYIENERGGRLAEVREAAEALRTALAAQTYELDPSIRLNGLEIALANCEKSHELTAKKYMDTFDENERLKEQMKKWMKAGGDNDTTR